MDKLKVVIADDERLFLQGMSTLLQAQGEEFVLAGTAANGEEALQLVEEHHPDILLTDIRMPRMDGIELIRQIEQRGLSVLVIIISAYDDREYVQYAIRSPVVYDYINKPFNKEEFAEQLRTAGAYRRQMRKKAEEENGGEWLLIQAAVQGETQRALSALRTVWSRRQDREPEACVQYAGELLMKIGLKMPAGKEDPQASALRLFHEIRKLEQCRSGEEAEQYLENYIIRLGEKGEKAERGKSVFILSCLDIINRRLEDSSLSVSEVARELDVTDNYLSARFSRDMNVTFTRYVTMARIERAKEYLKDPRMKIYTISEKLGFNDPRYFVKVFKEQVGMRPSEYREQILSE